MAEEYFFFKIPDVSDLPDIYPVAGTSWFSEIMYRKAAFRKGKTHFHPETRQ